MTRISEREVIENLRTIVENQRDEFQMSLPLPPRPLTGSKVTDHFKDAGYLQRLHIDVNSTLFKHQVRTDPVRAVKAFRGRVFQDTQWISIMSNQTSEWETPVSESNTFNLYRELYKGGRKKFPLNSSTLKGVSTPDCMLVRQVGPKDFKIINIYEITLAEENDYFRKKHEHFLDHRDHHPDYFGYTLARFVVPKDQVFALPPSFKFAKVIPGSLDKQEFEEFLEEISENLPVVQYALSCLRE